MKSTRPPPRSSANESADSPVDDGAPEKKGVAPEKKGVAPEKTGVAPEKTGVAPEKAVAAEGSCTRDVKHGAQGEPQKTRAERIPGWDFRAWEKFDVVC